MKGSRYGRYTGGPDTLAAPTDAQAASRSDSDGGCFPGSPFARPCAG
jgi:uncharacterized protein with von Willebrand factor type A (vWA) domain